MRKNTRFSNSINLIGNNFLHDFNSLIITRNVYIFISVFLKKFFNFWMNKHFNFHIHKQNILKYCFKR